MFVGEEHFGRHQKLLPWTMDLKDPLLWLLCALIGGEQQRELRTVEGFGRGSRRL